MKGFFNREEIISSSQNITNTTKKRSACGACGLWKTCPNPKMKVTGKGEKGIFIWTEVQGEREGNFKRKLRKLGIDLNRDCWKMNSVICQPPDDRIPTPAEIEYCRSNIWKTVKEIKPKAILLMGSIAIKSFLGHRWKKNLGGIDKWRKWQIPDRDVNAWVFPMFHPGYVSRSKNYQKVVETIFDVDLKNVIKHHQDPFPEYQDEKEQIKILSNEKQVREYLTEVYRLRPKILAFDYETTGLKPQAKGHEIVSCSMCWNNSEAASWMWRDTDQLLFRKILQDKEIGKIASNVKFEDTWTVERAGFKIDGWLWDTMLAAHIEDNRPGITSLKFQMYRRYGLLDYDSHLSYLLKSTGGGNGINRIHEIPEEELLIYNGIDSLGEYRLAIDQMSERGILN